MAARPPPPDDRGAPRDADGGAAEGPRIPPPPYERNEGIERGAEGAERAPYEGASKRRGAAAWFGMRPVGGELPIQRDDREVPGAGSNEPPVLVP